MSLNFYHLIVYVIMIYLFIDRATCSLTSMIDGNQSFDKIFIEFLKRVFFLVW